LIKSLLIYIVSYLNLEGLSSPTGPRLGGGEAMPWGGTFGENKE